MSSFAIVWELLKYRPGRFAFAALLWTTMHGSPVVFAILIGQVFDRLSGDAPAAESPVDAGCDLCGDLHVSEPRPVEG